MLYKYLAQVYFFLGFQDKKHRIFFADREAILMLLVNMNIKLMITKTISDSLGKLTKQ